MQPCARHEHETHQLLLNFGESFLTAELSALLGQNLDGQPVACGSAAHDQSSSGKSTQAACVCLLTEAQKNSDRPSQTLKGVFEGSGESSLFDRLIDGAICTSPNLPPELIVGGEV